MQRAGELHQTPSLICADVADQVGRDKAAIETRPRPVGADRARYPEIVKRCALPNGRVVQPDGRGYAVAELGGVLNVVDAGIGVLAPEQKRREIPGKALPRRGIARSRLAEGEPGEL